MENRVRHGLLLSQAEISELRHTLEMSLCP